MFRRRRRKAPPEPPARHDPLLRTYGLCPFPRCDRLIESWQVSNDVVEQGDVEPLWPGGPLVEVPGVVRLVTASSTASFQPCGHVIAWRSGDRAPFVYHEISVPLDVSPGKARARLLAIRDGQPDPG